MKSTSFILFPQVIDSLMKIGFRRISLKVWSCSWLVLKMLVKTAGAQFYMRARFNQQIRVAFFGGKSRDCLLHRYVTSCWRCWWLFGESVNFNIQCFNKTAGLATNRVKIEPPGYWLHHPFSQWMASFWSDNDVQTTFMLDIPYIFNIFSYIFKLP